MKSLFFRFCVIALVAAPAAAQTTDQTAGQTATQTAGQTATQTADPGAAAATVPAAVATSGNLPVTLPSDYQLGSGDRIRVEVYKEPQLSQSVQVRPDGKITLPLIGDMTAAGLTPAQLRDRIAAAFKDYVRNDPPVSVIVVDALASTVYVMGEVNKPGTIALTGPTSIVQALAMAGGFKDFAKTSDVRILRPGPAGVDTLHFNYDDAVKGKGKMLYLQRGDTIIVR